jgi:hypothetical protein
MFTPEIVMKNVVVEGGGKRVEVSNPHIASEQEGSFSSENYEFYKITINFSVIDQYNDSGRGSWIENQDIKKYIKFSINYFTSSTFVVRNTVELTNFLGEVNIDNYLVIDSMGGRRYEYPMSYTITDIPVTIQRLPVSISAYFDFKQYVRDQGLSDFYIVNEFSDPRHFTIINSGEILNVSNITNNEQEVIGSLEIINNVIIEDIEKLQINLSFVDSFEKNIVSIIETDTNKNKDISVYVTDLFISKNEDNTHSFLFGIDKKKIIQTKTQLGNYITAVSNEPQLQTTINDNIIINKIYVTKRQVKKVKSFSKLGNKDNDYTAYDDTPNVLFILDGSNKTRISNNSAYDFYSFTDTSISNDNSMFQYTLTIQLQDSFKESLVALQATLSNNITTLEQYYNQISIPFVNSKIIENRNPHIDSSSESFGITNIFGYYDIQTNTFKNNAVSLVPSNLLEIVTNFSVLYFFISAINKSVLDTAFVYLNSTKLISSLQKSLSVSTSSLYTIKKTIEIMKNFASTVERILDIQLVDIQPEREGSQTIKIGTNATEIIDLTYVFNNVVENTYYNNFKENKILIVESSQEVNNFPIVTTSKLALLLRDTESYFPMVGEKHKFFGENTFINTLTGIDTKSSRLLITYLNNLMSYLQEKDLNIKNNNTDEASNKIVFANTVKYLDYKTLIGDLLSQNGVEILSFKQDLLLQEKLRSSPNVLYTARDPLAYSSTTPIDYPLSSNNFFNSSQQDNSSRDESVTRLLNYILFKLNFGNKVVSRVVEPRRVELAGEKFAKLDNEAVSGLINKFIPNYNIQYLNNFGENIKDYTWTNFNNITFSIFPLRTNLLCRLKPITSNDQAIELKNVIDKLQVPYMYFILVKDNNEYNNETPSVIIPLINTTALTLSASVLSQGRFTSNQTQRFEPNRSRRIKKIRTK